MGKAARSARLQGRGAVSISGSAAGRDQPQITRTRRRTYANRFNSRRASDRWCTSSGPSARRSVRAPAHSSASG